MEMRQLRGVELRTEGRRLVGVAMPYGSIGRSPHGPELFEPGAFEIGDDALDRTSEETVDIIVQRLNNPSNSYRLSRIDKLQRGHNPTTLSFVEQMKTR